jgi:indolepyruvate ferredoxin oxidoreductase alpha subunit
VANMIVLGDEAVALGAIDGGISSAYGYPGTPSTEIMEYLLQIREKTGKPYAAWGSNEKTAYEEALGASYAGKRVLVTMKHVGLNVAADAFMNSALLEIKGGVVLAVADDPSMHSSQNEQDSRYFADFARIICLEPVNQQQAYDMTKNAFDLSEKMGVPVMIRLVTRLSHSRAAIETGEKRAENPLEKAKNKMNWMLLPANARRRWDDLLARQADFKGLSESTEMNPLILEGGAKTGVITSGLAYNYFMENKPEIKESLSHLHVGFYPYPEEKIRTLAASVDRLVILEEGAPFIERYLRGILPQNKVINGKIDGNVPLSGELNPDNVRPVLGLEAKGYAAPVDSDLARRPPQLCKGCPHEDTYGFINEARESFEESICTSDIGCYALGALPPYSACETIICMGASITAAKGAAEAGYPAVCAVIGDSTFYHSGLTGLVDCVSHQAPVTVVIVDNETVGMTGGQETILPSSRLEGVVLGLGIEKEHMHVLHAHRKDHEKNVEIMKRELSYKGPSVIIAARDCIEHARKKISRAKAEKGAE